MSRKFLFACLLLLSTNGIAYDPVTHTFITGKAIEMSVLKDRPKLEQLGLHKFSVTKTNTALLESSADLGAKVVLPDRVRSIFIALCYVYRPDPCVGV